MAHICRDHCCQFPGKSLLLIFKNRYLANADHAHASAMMRLKSPLSIANWAPQADPQCSTKLQPLARTGGLRPRAWGGSYWCDGVALRERNTQARTVAAAIVRRASGANVDSRRPATVRPAWRPNGCGGGPYAREPQAPGRWLVGFDPVGLGRCTLLPAASSANIRQWTAAYIRICRLDSAMHAPARRRHSSARFT